MTKQELGLFIHGLQFKLACHEVKGQAFQKLFEQIMQKHDRSFILVKPSGRAGDWKCDGLSQDSGTIYQCYAPDELTASAAAKKVKEDFYGARKQWGQTMKSWVFVWSAVGSLPPQVVGALQEIRNDNKAIKIEDLGREGLWNIVKGLSEGVRTEILGVVPDLDAVSVSTTAEIQTLLKFLTREEFAHETELLDLTEISEKLKRNRLSASIRAIVTPSIPVAKLVEKYVTRHPDPQFSAQIANNLAVHYKRLADQALEPDLIFWQMMKYVAAGEDSDAKTFWAATGILAYYFQLCDIFEQ